MLHIKLSYIVNHITLTLGGLLVLVHLAVTTEQLEVKQDDDSQKKLYVKLTYSASEELNTESITDTDYRDNCLCRGSHPTYKCPNKNNPEKIVIITWSSGSTTTSSTTVMRQRGCTDSRYSFNVTTTNIQVGLERNEAGDELNVTLVCVNTSSHVYVNDVSQQSDEVKLEFSKEPSGGTSVRRFFRSIKQTVSDAFNWILRAFTASTDHSNNDVTAFYCGVANTTDTTSVSATIRNTTKPANTSTTTHKTTPTTNQNSTQLLNEQDLILIVVIPVVAVVVIIIVIIIVVVICVRRKRKSSASAVKYHVPPTDPNYNRRSAIDEESDYNILGERVPVHCDEDDYDCPYSQNTKPRKLPVKTQPEGSTYEDVDHLDLKDQLDSSPGSNNSTKPLHQPDPSQLYSAEQKDRRTEDDQGIIMVENDLYE